MPDEKPKRTLTYLHDEQFYTANMTHRSTAAGGIMSSQYVYQAENTDPVNYGDNDPIAGISPRYNRGGMKR